MEKRSQPVGESLGTEQLLDELVAEISEKLHAGQAVELDQYAREHPEVADELRRMLPALEALAELGNLPPPGAISDEPSSRDRGLTRGVLGDYRILREIGRGGMGVVYEAEQVSLGRKVALKVLPFAAMLDKRQLQRFQNEARAAACLRHPNIVQIHSVGCERAVHFYAMDYIEGQTLAEVIRDLRRGEGLDAEEVGGGEAESGKRKAEVEKRDEQVDSALADSLASGRFAPPKAGCEADAPTAAYAQETTPDVAEDTGPEPQAAVSTERSTKSPAYFRSIAEIGVQVARALDHAHEQGVIHRDVKPSNVILDAQGKPWITDFGLARIETDGTLTISGDLLGTVRYMSPEQALAKRIVVDHRTDVYSLGVTLYELLTLQPAFTGQDREELLRQIAFEEPKAPRRLNKSVPAELETIVLKAMAKNPAERYDTAQELADDLERFLEDKPIRAKRPSLVQRAAKWSRRHRTVAASTAIATALVLLSVTVGALLLAQKEREIAHSQSKIAEQERTARDAAETARDREAELRARAEQAEREKSELLWKSYLNEAKALRWTRRSGQRFQSLEALQKAADVLRSLGQLDDHVLEVRNEAIACMALSDMRVFKKGVRESTPASDMSPPSVFDANYERYARQHSGNVVVYRASDGQELMQLVLPARGAPLKFSRDGRFLLGIHWNGGPHCLVWDLERRHLILDVRMNCRSADFSPDSRWVVVGRPDGSVELYELPSAKLRKSLSMGGAPLLTRFSTSGKRLAVVVKRTPGGNAYRGEAIEIWDVDGAELDMPLSDPDSGAAGFFGGLSWHPRGRFLAAGYLDGAVRVWDVRTGQQRAVLRGHNNEIWSVAFASGSDILASRSLDGTTRLWHPLSERELVRGAGWWALSDFGRRDQRLGAWEVIPGREFRTFQAAETHWGPCYVDFSPDGRLMVWGDGQGIRLWDTALREEVAFLYTGGTASTVLNVSTVFNPVKERLLHIATTNREHAGLYRWPIARDAKSDTLRLGPPERLDQGGYEVCLSRDGRYLVASTDKDRAYVRRVDGPDEKIWLDGHSKAHHVAISPDGRWVATACLHWMRGGSGVKVWDAKSGELLRDLWPDSGGAHVAFSPDGKCLVAGSYGEYRFWEVGSWKEGLRIPRIYEGRGPTPVAYTRDGGTLAITHSRYVIQLIDTATGGQFASLEAPDPRQIWWLCFSPDGSQLAIACNNQVVQMWDLRLIRKQLAAMGLDWDLPPYPPAAEEDESKEPLCVEIELGELGHWVHSQRGHAYRGLGLGEQSVDEYTTAIEHNPEDSATWSSRGYVYCELEQWDQALGDYTKALELADDNLVVWYYLALTQLAMGREGEYRQTCRDMLARLGRTDDPDTAEWVARTCALAPDAVADVAKPIELVRASLAKSPQSHQYLSTLGAVLYRAGRFEEAIKHLREADRVVPNPDPGSRSSPAYTWFFLAMAHHRKGNSEEARKWLEKGIEWTEKILREHHDGTGATVTWNRRLTLGLLRREAESLDEADEEAVADLQEAIDRRPEDPALWLRRARFRANRGQPQQASADFARALELDPRDPHVLQEMAQFCLGTDDLERAIMLYGRAIGLEPDNAQLRIGRGEIHEKVGQWSQAVADFSSAIELSPDHADLWIRRGEAYEKWNQWDKAAADFCKALELQPQDRKLWKDRAEDYVALKQLDAAMLLYSKLVEVAPDYAEPWWDRADIHVQRGDYDKAIADCNEAIRLGSEDSSPYRIRGLAYLATDEVDKAVADFDQALRLGPGTTLKTLQTIGDALTALTTTERFDRAAKPARRIVEIRAESVAASPKDRLRRKDLAWAQYTLGNILFAAGRREEAADAYRPAMKLFEELADEFPDVSKHHGHLAGVLSYCPAKEFRNGRRAIAAYERVLELSGSHPNWWLNVSLSHYAAGDYRAAIDSIEKGRSELGGEVPNAFELVLGMSHWWLGEGQQGRKFYDRHLEQFGHDEFESWIEYRFVRAEADKMFAATEPGLDPQPWLDSAQIHVRQRRRDQAIADCCRAIKVSSDNSQLSKAHQTRAEAHLALGRYEEALADWNRCVELRGDNAVTALVRAQMLLTADRTEEYRQACGEMLDRYGESESPGEFCHAARACALAPKAIPDPTVPVKLAAEAVSRDPIHWHLYTLGMAHLRAGQLDEATQRFRESLKTDPAWQARFLNWLGLALVHHGRGEPKEARQSLAEAVDLIEQHAGPSVQDRLEGRLLRREVEQLLETPEEKDEG